MCTASIDIQLAERYSPIGLLCRGLESGWKLGAGDEILSLHPNDKDFDWIRTQRDQFDLPGYLAGFTSDRQKIGLTITLNDSRGGEAVIYGDHLFFQLSFNQLCDDGDVVDFSWYLRALRPFLDTVTVHTIECLQFMD